jgi:hypothetical protein
MNKKSISFLLRLWKIQSDGKWTWRASLEFPYTGKRKGFASLMELFLFLTNLLAEMNDVPPEEESANEEQ